MPAEKGNDYAKGNKGGGRVTLYKDEYSTMAYKFCLLGATDSQLADLFEVSEATINNWKKDHEEFSLALKKGKTLADASVADRLYQRALGFEHPSEEIKVVSAGAGMPSLIERVPITKVYPPDTTAAIFWLKNRRPKEWRDKTEVESNNTNTNYNSAELTPEEIKKINKSIEDDY